MNAEDLGALFMGLFTGWAGYEAVRLTLRKRCSPTREGRWSVRYERMYGSDPIDTQWKHREAEMNQRQARLDASQDVMTRLVEPSPKNKANKVLVGAYNRVYGDVRK